MAHSEATQRNRMENGRALLRDALSYERPGHRMRIAREDTISEARGTRAYDPPVGLETFAGALPSSRSENRRVPAPSYMPTPPYTSNETPNRSPPYISTPPLPTASLTPRFAPAHRLEREDEARANLERVEVLARLASRMAGMSDPGEQEYIAGHRAEINRMRSRSPTELTLEYREAEAAYLESVETRLDLMQRMRERDLSDLPPLRRMNRPFQDVDQPTRGHSRGQFDGLGDRERSFSPDDDHWETMLTTVRFPLHNRLLDQDAISAAEIHRRDLILP